MKQRIRPAPSTASPHNQLSVRRLAASARGAAQPAVLLTRSVSTQPDPEPTRSLFFFFKQKTAYEISTRDWSSDVCSSDLPLVQLDVGAALFNGSNITR